MLVGLDAQAFLARVQDDRRFLVGGWFDSRVLQICSGGIGPPDPNPLAARGCPPFHIEAIPRSLHFPERVVLPDGDGPIVLEVHANDPGAATCIPEYRLACSLKVVVHEVRWFGDEVTAAIPIGPNEAQSRVLRLPIADIREQPDGSTFSVSGDLFMVPLSCGKPWPTYVFRIHGDPRHGLVAVFPDPDARAAFEAGMDPADAGACLGTTYPRPGPPRWLSLENVLVLTFGDDRFGAALGRAMTARQNEDVPSVPLPLVPADQTEQTLFDYLAARSSGMSHHAYGERLTEFRPGAQDGGALDTYEGWVRDMLRRHVSGALDGSIERINVPLDAGGIGPQAAEFLGRQRVTEAAVYRVRYAGTREADLAVEEFVVFRIADATFRDWTIIRVAGAPYPPRP